MPLNVSEGLKNLTHIHGVLKLLVVVLLSVFADTLEQSDMGSCTYDIDDTLGVRPLAILVAVLTSVSLVLHLSLDSKRNPSVTILGYELNLGNVATLMDAVNTLSAVTLARAVLQCTDFDSDHGRLAVVAALAQLMDALLGKNDNRLSPLGLLNSANLKSHLTDLRLYLKLAAVIALVSYQGDLTDSSFSGCGSTSGGLLGVSNLAFVGATLATLSLLFTVGDLNRVVGPELIDDDGKKVGGELQGDENARGRDSKVFVMGGLGVTFTLLHTVMVCDGNLAGPLVAFLALLTEMLYHMLRSGKSVAKIRARYAVV